MTSPERYARYREIAADRMADNDNTLMTRRAEGERRHLENEAYWLAQERLKYGISEREQAKPLSRMRA
ncbi:hypothetical protein [Novosphingobium sp.]|uniref:hypothetical protein n=1 Tax=Novosphingobium sp. TaxID=1874826 RepID=UPI002FDAE259